MTEWKYFPDECGHCGGELEVDTEETEEGWARDGDPVRCVACKAIGMVVVGDVDDVSIFWNEESEVVE